MVLTAGGGPVIDTESQFTDAIGFIQETFKMRRIRCGSRVSARTLYAALGPGVAL